MSNDWIEINLPWYFEGQLPLLSDVDEEVKDRATIELGFNHEHLSELLEKASKFIPQGRNLEQQNPWTVEYREKREQYYDWLDKQPEYKQLEKDRQACIERNNHSSFSGRKLNQPGTLIEVEVGGQVSQYLIGDINTVRGVCDDCCGFDCDALVKRYKIVWSKE